MTESETPSYLVESKILVGASREHHTQNDLSKQAAQESQSLFSKNDLTSETPVYIMATRQETFRSSSTLTASEFSTTSVSTALTDGTSSIWSYSDPKPPKLINVAVESTSLPYAQLCFDPESKTLVTLMEINLGGIGRRKKRLCIVDTAEASIDNSPKDERQAGTIYSSSPTSGTLSTDSRTEDHYDEPIVLSCFGQGSWLEETDLDLHLLHDCGDPWDAADNRKGCTEALKRILLASRSLVVFKLRDHTRWEYTQGEHFSGIGYTMLDEE